MKAAFLACVVMAGQPEGKATGIAPPLCGYLLFEEYKS